MVGGSLRLRRIEVLEEASGEDLTPLAKEDSLLVAECDDPRQFRGRIPPRPTIDARDPARRESRATEGRSPRSIGWQQTLKRGLRESSMATGRGEHPETAGITPAADGGG
jgi:hypothetical protein